MNWEQVEKYCNIISDPIYGYIEIDEISKQFINTKHFQRLRNLKQLSVLHYTYPSANHTRFEHCLGTSHLSYKLINKIKNKQPELNVSNKDCQLIRLAGLLHDIGHGPFSHTFDNIFINQFKGITNYSHEVMSLKIIDDLIDTYAIDIENDDVNKIKQYITGEQNGFMNEIVANKKNGIDMDKFDYLSRDTLHLFGNKKSYDYSKLLKYNRVIDNTIAYDINSVYDVYTLFQQRYEMHKNVYTNSIANGFELLICDLLKENDKKYNISNAIYDVNDFLNLDDTIINIIRYSNNKSELTKNIINRIDNFKPYIKIGDCLAPSHYHKEMKPEDIISYQKNKNIKINIDDIVILKSKLNFNLKSKNPVDNVSFYHAYDNNVSFKHNKYRVSLLLPNVFEENVIKVFSKSLDNEINKELKYCFQKYISKSYFIESIN